MRIKANRVAQRILDSAPFKCPFKCAPKMVLPSLTEFETHVLEECPLTPISCEQGCGSVLCRKD